MKKGKKEINESEVTTPKSYIGKVVKFNDHGFNYAKNGLAQNILPIVETLQHQFEVLLGKGSFTQARYNDMLVYRLKNIERECMDNLEKEMSAERSFVKEGERKILHEKLLAVENTWERLTTALLKTNENANLYIFSLPLELNMIVIDEVGPKIDTVYLKELFELKIKTSAQNKMYALMLETQTGFNKLSNFVKECGSELVGLPNVLGEFVYYDEITKSLEIDVDSLSWPVLLTPSKNAKV